MAPASHASPLPRCPVCLGAAWKMHTAGRAGLECQACGVLMPHARTVARSVA